MSARICESFGGILDLLLLEHIETCLCEGGWKTTFGRFLCGFGGVLLAGRRGRRSCLSSALFGEVLPLRKPRSSTPSPTRSLDRYRSRGLNDNVLGTVLQL